MKRNNFSVFSETMNLAITRVAGLVTSNSPRKSIKDTTSIGALRKAITDI